MNQKSIIFWLSAALLFSLGLNIYLQQKVNPNISVNKVDSDFRGELGHIAATIRDNELIWAYEHVVAANTLSKFSSYGIHYPSVIQQMYFNILVRGVELLDREEFASALERLADDPTNMDDVSMIIDILVRSGDQPDGNRLD